MTTPTIQWAVTSMSCYPQDAQQTDVVFRVNWSCTARLIDGLQSYNAVENGAVGVEYTQGQPFTPYDQLTQDQVLGWVWEQVDKADVEAKVTANIAAQAAPPVVNPPLPWSN